MYTTENTHPYPLWRDTSQEARTSAWSVLGEVALVWLYGSPAAELHDSWPPVLGLMYILSSDNFNAFSIIIANGYSGYSYFFKVIS